MEEHAKAGPPRDAVKSIFARIAGRYDLLNTLLSFGQDRRWRRIAAERIKPGAAETFLDLAAGTGAFSKALGAVCPQVHIIAADFCLPILSRMPPLAGQRVGADGLKLPFRDGSFDGFVIAFGLRNFSDPAEGLRQIHRVLKSGGRGVVLEFLQPENSFFGFLYRFYLNLWVTLLGGILTGSFSAYRHLTRTIHGFCTREEIKTLAENAGFRVGGLEELTFGASTAIFLIKKP